ncbi:MarR family winged helix-turn-helix transcriptional regulator [Microbacterium sp. Marseille-Q6965]|uniref:MarR family winged helix-turn-helix transcriptional regulator n=1 Tax=Microbacterium sp. Marseille-Q6965 TaxID=2965072 RepID=UPI0021B8203F|nr:MarR family transcriptional regulator [Microbacterium sp. Marseille-Q6965]
MAFPTHDAASGYWYPDAEGTTTVDVLTLLRRYRSAETAMRARTRAQMRMNETDLMALRYLLREKHAGRPVRPVDLARYLHISTASVTTLVDRLVRDDHARREPHPTDRRTQIIVPTAHSDTEVRATLGPMHQRMLALVDGLSEGERAVVARFLEGMTAAVEEAAGQDEKPA